MKSLLERAKARPSYSLGIVIVGVAFLFFFWWHFSSNPQENTPQHPKSSMITNQKVTIPVKSSETSAPTPIVANTAHATPTSVPTITTTAPATMPTTPAHTALPTDPTTAAEELDRLKDEQNRLKERKTELAKQLAISDKLIRLKDQQLKDYGQTNP